jgi:hypothetical protein
VFSVDRAYLHLAIFLLYEANVLVDVLLRVLVKRVMEE